MVRQGLYDSYDASTGHTGAVKGEEGEGRSEGMERGITWEVKGIPHDAGMVAELVAVSGLR